MSEKITITVEETPMPVQLDNLLKKNKVRFTYNKKDGTTRKAYGTRMQDVLEENTAVPKGTMTKETEAIRYFDLEKKAWRSFLPEMLVSIDGVDF